MSVVGGIVVHGFVASVEPFGWCILGSGVHRPVRTFVVMSISEVQDRIAVYSSILPLLAF